MLPFYTNKLPPPHKYFPKPPLPSLAKFPKETRNNKQKKDAEKFSVFFLVEQIINLSNQFTQWLRPSYRLLLWDIRAVMIGKHIKNRGVKQKSALRHPVFSYSMGDTLISPIVASYLLYLAVTYTLIRTYLDKPDNLHFNGDYRKKLNCSHYYLGIFMYDWTNNILYAKYPLGKPKKTDTPFRERMPALICHTLPK